MPGSCSSLPTNRLRGCHGVRCTPRERIGSAREHNPTGSVVTMVEEWIAPRHATIGSLSRLVAFRYTGNLRWVGVDHLGSAGPPVNESYRYGQTGNITQRNGLALSYDPGHPHVVSAYDGTSY